MTVQEAIRELHNIRPLGGIIPQKRAEAIDIAIKCMEEVEQYRALEEKLNGISIEHIVNAFIERVEKDTNEGYEKGRILTNAEADMWEQYRALGTVEELKEAREKQKSRRKWYQLGYQDGLNAKPIKPKTNADRIRNMTDEELAKFLGGTHLHNCKIIDCIRKEENDKRIPLCSDCFLEWLQAEVKEGAE